MLSFLQSLAHLSALESQGERELSAKSGQIEARKNSPRMAGSGVLPTLPDVIQDFGKSPNRT
jgi:hypothetical protein